jgi:type IV secretory pathway VirB2 component (pilin)
MAPRPLFSIRLTARALAILALVTVYVATSFPANTPALAQQPPEAAPAQPAAPLPDAQAMLAGPFTQSLAISGIVRSGRSLVRLDSFSHLIATDPSKATPQEGDTLPKPDGSLATWQSVNAGENNAFASDVGQGGYLFCTRENTTSQPRVMVLEAKGHGVAIVNGEPRMGDPYGYGYMSLPVLLQPGINTFVFAPAGRGEFSASLREPHGLVEIETGDITAPDMVKGEENRPVHLGIPLRNCSVAQQTVRLSDVAIGMHTQYEDMGGVVIVLPPLSMTKVSLTTRVPFSVREKENEVVVGLVR